MASQSAAWPRGGGGTGQTQSRPWTWVLGHRGAHHGVRENTLDAFRLAASQGADGVELDVRRTGDGALVVHHDAVVPGIGPIWAIAANELPGWLPRLTAALDACRDLAIVNIEIKNSPIDADFDTARSVATDVAAVLEARLGPPAGPRLLVSSFDLLSIDAHRRRARDVATGWLTLAGYDQAAALDTAAGSAHAALHPQESAVTVELVHACHRRGLEVFAWTVDDPVRAAELAGFGVDGIITNDVEAVIAVCALSRRAR